MTLEAGVRLGPYTVTGSLGAGGMGEVYRARDTKLNRDVALKVLPDAFTNDPDRLARFQREAEVLASLNHPNIAGIHGLEDSDDVRALVLELVEGPTLEERIAAGSSATAGNGSTTSGMPLDDVLPIARQIADALEAAHEAGVVHRDLKPANVKVRDDGTVKVLDFGLAKAFQPEATDPGLSLSPTISLTAAATQIGMVLGTAAYMAPEQAKGKPVDKRADIWAFGAVLYEMLTGRKAFGGDDVSETMAHVLTKEVEWDALPGATSPPLVRLLKRCLERNPKARLRDIGEARIALTESIDADDVPTETPAQAPPAAMRFVAVTATAVVVTALVTTAVMQNRAGPAGSAADRAKRFVMPLTGHTLPVSGPGPFVTVSADGGTVVYTGVRDGQLQLFRRRFDELQAFPIQGTENARRPFLSPDGQSVGFVTGGNFEIMRQVSLSGGTPSTVLDVPDRERSVDARLTDQIQGAVWGPDDRIVYGSGTAIFSIPAAGGEPVQLTTRPVESDVLSYRWPQLVPGTDVLLYTRWRGSISTSDLVAYSLATGEERRLVNGSGVHHTASGHIVFGDDTELMAAPFDPDQLALTGAPVRLAEDLLTFVRGGAANFAATADTLVYVSTSVGLAGSETLVRVDHDGSNPTPVHTDPLQSPRHLQLSPDAQQVVLISGPTEQGQIWVYPVDGRPPTSLRQEGQNTYPQWTHGGSRLTFSTNRADDGNRSVLVWLATDGSMTEPEVLLEGADRYYASAWVPQRDELIFGQDTQAGQTRWDLRRLGSDGEVDVVVQTRSDERVAQISPNGRFMAYESTLNERTEIWVRPYPDGAPTRISGSGGGAPRWSHDGTELYFLERGNFNRSRMMAASVDTEGEGGFETPVPLFQQRYDFGDDYPYVVLPDGDFILNAGPLDVAVDDAGTELLQGDYLIAIVDLDAELNRIAPPN